MSLRKKLTLSMLMIAVIPVMVLGSFYYQYFSGVLLSNVQQRELQNNSQIIYSVDNFFNSIFKISDSLLMNEELMDICRKAMRNRVHLSKDTAARHRWTSCFTRTAITWMAE